MISEVWSHGADRLMLYKSRDAYESSQIYLNNIYK